MEPLYHSTTQRQLAAISSGSGSYLFIGPAGSGRQLAAIRLAQRLNCPSGSVDDCLSCRNLAAGSFADLIRVQPTTTIGIEQIQQLQQPLAQRPFSAGITRMVIIELDAGITPEAQNRLLKTLEEPPAQTIIILITEHTERLLATVLSRCQVVNFVPLPVTAISEYLASTIGPEAASRVEQLQPASIGQAWRLAHDEDWRLGYVADYQLAQSFLAAPTFGRLVMAQTIRLKSRADSLIAMLARQLRGRPELVSGYLALERAEAELAANVGPRTVLEALALAL